MLRGGRAVAVSTDAGEVDADVVVVACDPAVGCPRWRRSCGGRCPRLPPGGDPRRARGRAPGPGPRDRAARRRGKVVRRWPVRARGSRVDAAGSWPGRRGPARRRWRGATSTCARRVDAGRPLPPRPGRRSGAGRRAACCGRAARRRSAGSARRRRCPGCTPPGRTPPRRRAAVRRPVRLAGGPSSSGPCRVSSRRVRPRVTVTVNDAAIVVSPGSMATDFIMSRARRLRHADRPGGTALGHRLDLAEAGSGELRRGDPRAPPRRRTRRPGRAQRRAGRTSRPTPPPGGGRRPWRPGRPRRSPAACDVRAGDAQGVPRLEAARLPSLS